MLQSVFYNGQKRKLELKFQGMNTNDGLYIHMYSPEVGGLHEMFLYAPLEMYVKLMKFMKVNGKQLDVYRDYRYSWSIYLEVPFPDANPSAVQDEFKKETYTVIITIERYFECVQKLWSFVDSKRETRVGEIPEGVIFRP